MRVWQNLVALVVAATFGSASLAQGPSVSAPAATSSPGVTVPAPAARPSSSPALERGDLEAWLDGYMPYAMARGGVAGGVVVVVKDGQVLLQKGYGYADVAKRRPVDPVTTLFRPGSVSKLLTWTAVMQLVEQGKLNLDEDINTYLDFKIPSRQGKPITLRNILTHTAGFEESARYTITDKPLELGPLMKKALPKRIFAPGTTPAYSNYATALAGYIVARASGLTFDDYIEQRVMRPIGMNRSTFRQPLPPAYRPFLSQAYGLASEAPKPFEYVGPAPAGSLSATGADMAKFMIAHLANGRGLMRPQTAQLMHESKLDILPPLRRMALGFYEADINGHRIIAHGGDTQYFHSDLALFIDDGVGLFVSLNSAGKEGVTRPIRNSLVKQFADRYFPSPLQGTPIDAATAKQHAEMFVGTYSNSRGFKTTFLRILDLMQPTKVSLTEDGGISADILAGTSGEVRKWIEIAPFVWRDSNSGQRVAAQVKDGQIVRWSFDEISPFMMFERVPWYVNTAWLLPLFLFALGVVLLTALSWPVGAINRRRYAAPMPFQGRRLSVYRSTRALTWLALALLAGWASFILVGLSDLPQLAGPLDSLLWTLQILSPLIFVGLVGFAGWSVWLGWTEKRGWFARTWALLLLLASLVFLWVAVAFNLIGFGTTF